MAFCGNYSHNLSPSHKHAPGSVVFGIVLVILYSYHHSINTSITLEKLSCQGVFVDPCSGQMFINSTNLGIHIEGIDSNRIKGFDVANLFTFLCCEYVIRSHTRYLRYTLDRDTCVVMQVRTPPWQYDPDVGSLQFQYDCRLILIQDHMPGQSQSVLHYDIKLFQHEASMVVPQGNFSQLNKEKHCKSHIDELPFNMEMTGHGDMTAFLFNEGVIRSQYHRIFNKWCPDMDNYVTTFTSSTCDTKIVTKSHNSSLLSHYQITETLSKLDPFFVRGKIAGFKLLNTGTFSLRFMTWSKSWITVKLQRTCHIMNTNGFVENICDFLKVSVCKQIKSQEMGSILRFTLNSSSAHNATPGNNFGSLNVNFSLKRACSVKPYLAYTVVLSLKKSVFNKGFYDVLLPADPKHFYVSLGQTYPDLHISVTSYTETELLGKYHKLLWGPYSRSPYNPECKVVIWALALNLKSQNSTSSQFAWKKVAANREVSGSLVMTSVTDWVFVNVGKVQQNSSLSSQCNLTSEIPLSLSPGCKHTPCVVK